MTLREGRVAEVSRCAYHSPFSPSVWCHFEVIYILQSLCGNDSYFCCFIREARKALKGTKIPFSRCHKQPRQFRAERQPSSSLISFILNWTHESFRHKILCSCETIVCSFFCFEHHKDYRKVLRVSQCIVIEISNLKRISTQLINESSCDKSDWCYWHYSITHFLPTLEPSICLSM